MTIALVALIVFVAQAVETTIGFGGMVVSVALGAFVMPLHELVPSLVLLGFLQSGYVLARYHRFIDGAALLTRILPAAAAGLGAGFAVAEHLPRSSLEPLFGATIAAIAVIELVRTATVVRPLRPWAATAALFGGGVVHGLFAAGGPLIVLYAARRLPDKRAFRATLAVLWVVLGALMTTAYALRGEVSERTILTALTLLPALAAGVWAGDVLHHRLPPAAFRRTVQVFLLLSGAALMVRAASQPSARAAVP